MTNAFLSGLRERLAEGSPIERLEPGARLVTNTPFDRMREFLTHYGPYSKAPYYGVIHGNSRELCREISDFRLTNNLGLNLGWGSIMSGVSDGSKDTLEAMTINYFGPNTKRIGGEKLSTTDIADLMVLEDGTIAWYFFSNKTLFSHVGFTYPPGKDKENGIPYPDVPIAGMAKYIEYELLAGITQTLASGQVFILSREKGRLLTLDEMSQLGSAKSPPQMPAVEMTPEELLKFTIDTNAFRALPEVLAFCIQAYHVSLEPDLISAYRHTLPKTGTTPSLSN